jgi:hypothetical protein
LLGDMSVFTAENDLKRARRALDDARKRQAAEERKAVEADKAAASKQRSAARTSTASSGQNYLRSAETKREEARKARAKAADYSAKIATAQANVHKAEVKLEKERARERSKQETGQERRRLAAESALRAADQQRARQVAMLETDLADARATLESRPWENVPEKITVLFITADPHGVQPLHIDREIRQIQEQVRSSRLRDSIAFEYRHAVRVTDLLQHLNEVSPDVVHFSGHGADAGIALHDADDTVRLLSNAQLGKVLAAAPKRLKLAVLNSCESAEQAQTAVEHVDAAIGMEQTIEDEPARVFAGQLYNSLGFGNSLGLAFSQARLQVDLTFNAVSGNPVLVMAEGINADELVIVSPGSSDAR